MGFLNGFSLKSLLSLLLFFEGYTVTLMAGVRSDFTSPGRDGLEALCGYSIETSYACSARGKRPAQGPIGQVLGAWRRTSL